VTGPRRVSLEPAFLLHHYAWRDTSRILELLTRAHGRVSVIARASRKTSATVGSVLQPFAAALVSWNARGELGYLTGAERLLTSPASAAEVARNAGEGVTSPAPAGEVAQSAGEGVTSPAGDVAQSAGEGVTSPASAGEVAQSAGEGSGADRPSPDLRSTSPSELGEVRDNRPSRDVRSTLSSLGEVKSLAGDRLMSGFYANELLLRLLQRNDPHPALFDAYAALLARLHTSGDDAGRALRIFEKRLLGELGWGLDLTHESASGAPLEPGRTYRYRLEGGAEPINGVAEGTLIFCGASLLSLAREQLDDPRSLADARRLLRAALDRLLEGRPLRTREVLLEMRAHSGKADGG
jgi:recombinational DNA repair protein (RecF pathway)